MAKKTIETENQVRIYFEDLSINANYQLLEWGKDNDELLELAKKKEIEVPSQDLSFFKCIYGMVDEENKNKCTLPKGEVKKALKSLNGKAIDKDHLRKVTIGHWLSAELAGTDIIAYGCFWKANFPEDYETIQEKMKEGKMKVSFEARGDRVFNEEGGYKLINIHFCGGALLFDTNPAFPDAEVIDFASVRENGVLEFAKIMEEGAYSCECIVCGHKQESEAHCKDISCSECGGTMRREDRPGIGQPTSSNSEELKMEESKFNFIPEDCMVIDKFLYETACPSCEAKGMYEVSDINFEKSTAKASCIKCGAKYTLNLEPEVTLEKKGKKIKEMTLSSEEVNKVDKTQGGSKVMDKILEKYSKATLEEVVFLLEGEIEKSKTKEAETKEEDSKLVEAKTEIARLQGELEEAKTSAKDATEKLDAKLETEKASVLKARKEELGEELAKDISDEDILDDVKFELAKTKKELADLKEEKGTSTETAGLEAGSSTETAPVFKKQQSVSDRAFGSDSE